MPIQVNDEEFTTLVSESHTLVEIIHELGLAVSGSAYSRINNRIRRLGLSISHFNPELSKNKGNHRKTSISPSDILVNNRTGKKEVSFRLRNAMLACGFVEVCSICNLSNNWNGKPLILQVDHINGDNTNNTPTNLRFVCPNCHTQTDTYGHKNVKKPTNPYKSQKVIVSDSIKETRRAKHRTNTVCNGCGIHFIKPNCRVKTSNYCARSCYENHKPYKIIWPPKDKMAGLVKQHSMTKLSEILGVSDKTIKNHCKKLGILS